MLHNKRRKSKGESGLISKIYMQEMMQVKAANEQINAAPHSRSSAFICGKNSALSPLSFE